MLQPQFENTRLLLVGVMDRREERLRDWAATENQSIRIIRRNDLGVELASPLPFTEELLQKITTEFFYDKFAKPTPVLGNGEWIVRFEFGPVLIPTNYCFPS